MGYALVDTLTSRDSSHLLPRFSLEPENEGIDGGERKLMAALLADGVEAYVRASLSQNDGTDVDDAIRWIEDDGAEGYVFSFDVVCECLGIDPRYLRFGLKRYIESVRVATLGGNVWKKIRRPRKR